MKISEKPQQANSNFVTSSAVMRQCLFSV